MKAYIVIAHKTGASEDEWVPIYASHDLDDAIKRAELASRLIDVFDNKVLGGSPFDAVRIVEVSLEELKRIRQELEAKIETSHTLQ